MRREAWTTSTITAAPGFDWRHRVNSAAHDHRFILRCLRIEPDYGIGASACPVARTSISTSTTVSPRQYSWTRRFSTVTSWTINGIYYDDDSLDGEDYLTNILAQVFR
jgi:hypothetical protein